MEVPAHRGRAPVVPFAPLGEETNSREGPEKAISWVISFCLRRLGHHGIGGVPSPTQAHVGEGDHGYIFLGEVHRPWPHPRTALCPHCTRPIARGRGDPWCPGQNDCSCSLQPCQAVMALPEESQREDALIGLNKAALELCQEPRPLQSDLLHQMW